MEQTPPRANRSDLLGALFRFIYGQGIRHPVRTMVLALLVTVAMTPGLLRLKLRTDGHALVSEDAPAVRYDQWVRDQFGLEDPVVVLVRSRHPEGIFNPETLQLVRELTEDLSKVPGLNPATLSSLATERGFRLRPGTLHFRALLETPRQTPAELAELRDDLRRIKLYTGTIVSKDGATTALLAGTPAGHDRTKLYHTIQGMIQARQSTNDQILLTGAPVAEALLGIHILEDLGVPQAWLGTSTRASTDRQSLWPTSFDDLRLGVSQKVGLVPIALLIMAAIFYASFRTVAGTALPLMEVGACLVFIFGLMGWVGVPIYLTIAVMPVLLTTMGVTDEIHLFHRYFELLKEHGQADHVARVETTMAEMWRPVVNTSLTTAIGFLSFVFSPVKPVAAFGLFTAIGVLYCLFWSLTVIPACFVLIHPKWFVRGGPPNVPATSLETSWPGRLAAVVVRWRYPALAALAVVVVALPFGLGRLKVQDSWIDGFAPQSAFRQATQLVNEQFEGMHQLCLTIEAGHPTLQGTIPASAISDFQIRLPANLLPQPQWLIGSTITITPKDEPPDPPNTPPPLQRLCTFLIFSVEASPDGMVVRMPRNSFPARVRLNPRPGETFRYEIVAKPHLQPTTVREIAALGAFIEEQRDCRVGGVLSAADYVATTSFMVRPQEESARQIPEDPVRINIKSDYYPIVRGPERLRQVVDTNYIRSLATIFLKEANFVDTARLMASIRSYERDRLTPHGIQLGFAGDVAVSQELIRDIVTTQLQSLAGSLVGILAVTSVIGRSLRFGLYCVVPSALAVVINFALMGWTGLPLGVATSMFAGMTLGTGVDFAIHVVERFQFARANGFAPDLAVLEAMRRTGPPVLINTLAIALGFGVLIFSQVPANARLGALLAISLLDCLIASWVLLPVLLKLWPLKAPLPGARCGRLI